MFGSRPKRVVIERPRGASRRWQRHGEVMPRRPVRVVEIIRETAEAVTVVIEPTDGKPLAFRAGQYLTHFFVIDGAPHKRAYSLSTPEGRGIAFTLKAIPGGVVSAYVASKLKPGDRYWVLGPSGEFTLSEGIAPLAFIAAGSGITPVVSLIETALARQPQRTIHLLYSSRATAETIFATRLQQLAGQHPSLRITSVYTQSESRVDAARINTWASEISSAVFYLCGPASLMESADRGLRLLQIPPERIRREVFLAAARETHARPTEPQEIYFKKSGKRIEQRPGESLLDAALRESVDIKFSCTVGGCGSCKVRVTGGECALSEPNCLTPEEKVQGFTLACSAFAVQPIVVDA